MAGRRLLRAPLFTCVSVLTLAVGIGATAAIFSVVNGVLLKPLPFHEPGRLVGVWHTAPGLGFPLVNQSPSTYFLYREDGRVFEDIGLWDNGAVSVTGVGEPERVDVLLVTDGTLPILRVQPALGRRFDRKDDAPKAPETVMLSHAYWQRKFGGASDVIGRRLVIEGRPREIIGVLPASFRFLSYDPQVLLPFQFNRAELFVGNFSYQGVARLKPGVTLEQANADVARLLPTLIEKFRLPPGFTKQMFDNVRFGPRVRPLSEDVIGDVGRVLWVLFGTVGIVLLIACANVANLFLVRAEGRQQELAVRAALGAGRGRLARELLSESLTLALIAGFVGAALASAGIRLLVAIAPEGLPRLHDITMSPLVLLFTFVVAALTGLLFGGIPVLRFATPRLTTALKEGGRGASDGRERHRLRSALVVTEIALALVLLVASGLMLRTFQAMRSVDPGFTRADEVLTLRISIPTSLIADPEQAIRTHEQIVRRIEQIPGVTSVGLSSSITMDGFDSNDPIFVEERPQPAGGMPPLRRFKWVSGNYFETMGTRLAAGRTLTWSDAYDTANVTVVSENFAREYWKEPAAALGKRIKQAPTNPWREIVGVVADERDDGLARPAPVVIYWPVLLKDFWDQPVFGYRNLAYAMRSRRLESPTFLKEIQQAVWSVNPSLPLSNVQTLVEIQAESMAQTSFAMVMLAIAAGVALLLGLVGIYGVIAYIAAQRTREIGIRVALGAQPVDVSRLFLRYGMSVLAVGVVLGLGASAVLTRLMSSLLFGVGAIDPATYGAVTAALACVSLLASYLPARRAARVDPLLALKSDTC
ncbi:MAG TPA: ABC transporter permease [Vicinamibacterales bacterium]|nr:ABC transporter permease [Vicinamibacterales bacterium]